MSLEVVTDAVDQMLSVVASANRLFPGQSCSCVFDRAPLRGGNSHVTAIEDAQCPLSTRLSIAARGGGLVSRGEGSQRSSALSPGGGGWSRAGRGPCV